MAINGALEQAEGEMLVVSEATTYFSTNVVENLVVDFPDYHVCCVVGRVSILTTPNNRTWSWSCEWDPWCVLLVVLKDVLHILGGRRGVGPRGGSQQVKSADGVAGVRGRYLSGQQSVFAHGLV